MVLYFVDEIFYDETFTNEIFTTETYQRIFKTFDLGPYGGIL
jgi:hypothetical protein